MRKGQAEGAGGERHGQRAGGMLSGRHAGNISQSGVPRLDAGRGSMVW
jgi:hypothetical protein